MSLRHLDEITNTEDMIDSHDVEKRIRYLEGLYDDAVDRAESAHEAKVEAGETSEPFQALTLESLDDFGMTDDERDELKHLKAFREEAEGYCADWTSGECLIRESYFVTYTQQFADDIGAVSKDNSGWIVIDWEATARNLRMDYSTAEFDGVTYLFR